MNDDRRGRPVSRSGVWIIVGAVIFTALLIGAYIWLAVLTSRSITIKTASAPITTTSSVKSTAAPIIVTAAVKPAPPVIITEAVKPITTTETKPVLVSDMNTIMPSAPLPVFTGATIDLNGDTVALPDGTPWLASLSNADNSNMGNTAAAIDARRLVSIKISDLLYLSPEGYVVDTVHPVPAPMLTFSGTPKATRACVSRFSFTIPDSAQIQCDQNTTANWWANASRYVPSSNNMVVFPVGRNVYGFLYNDASIRFAQQDGSFLLRGNYTVDASCVIYSTLRDATPVPINYQVSNCTSDSSADALLIGNRNAFLGQNYEYDAARISGNAIHFATSENCYPMSSTSANPSLRGANSTFLLGYHRFSFTGMRLNGIGPTFPNVINAPDSGSNFAQTARLKQTFQHSMTQQEPGICVSKRNPNIIVMNYADSLTPFIQGRYTVARSTNGGATWDTSLDLLNTLHIPSSNIQNPPGFITSNFTNGIEPICNNADAPFVPGKPYFLPSVVLVACADGSQERYKCTATSCPSCPMCGNISTPTWVPKQFKTDFIIQLHCPGNYSPTFIYISLVNSFTSPNCSSNATSDPNWRLITDSDRVDKIGGFGPFPNSAGDSHCEVDPNGVMWFAGLWNKVIWNAPNQYPDNNTADMFIGYSKDDGLTYHLAGILTATNGNAFSYDYPVTTAGTDGNGGSLFVISPKVDSTLGELQVTGNTLPQELNVFWIAKGSTSVVIYRIPLPGTEPGGYGGTTIDANGNIYIVGLSQPTAVVDFVTQLAVDASPGPFGTTSSSFGAVMFSKCSPPPIIVCDPMRIIARSDNVASCPNAQGNRCTWAHPDIKALNNGTLYMLTSEMGPQGPSQVYQTDNRPNRFLHLTHSNDHGKTWTPARIINSDKDSFDITDPAGATDASKFNNFLVHDDVTDKLAAVWLDTRIDTLGGATGVVHMFAFIN
jgi:hypothetical protein